MCRFNQKDSLCLSNQEEGDDWGRSFQSGADSTSSICTEEEEEETR